MHIVTGGAGFIGSAIVWGLNQRGIKDILIVDQNLENSTKKSNLDALQYADYLESNVFLNNLKKGQWNGAVQSIFHQGACSSTTEQNKSYLKENNTLYTQYLAEWSLKNNVYYSYASSAATYGDGQKGYSDEDQLTPQLLPLNPYGQSKLDFDIWVLEQGLQDQLIGFRYFNVYGPNEYHKGDMRSLVHKGYEQISATGKLKLFKSYRPEYPDGGQKRDFVYVKDVVDTVLWFFDHPDKKGIYNLGRGKAQTWNDLAHGLFKAMGKEPNIEYIEMPDSIKNQYQYFTEADLSKLRSAGCDIEFRDLEDGIQDYVENYLSRDLSLSSQTLQN